MARVWRDKDVYKLMLHMEFANQPVEVALYDGTTLLGRDIGFFTVSEVTGTTSSIGGESLQEIKAMASLKGATAHYDMQIAVTGGTNRYINRIVISGTTLNPGNVGDKVDLSFSEAGLTPIALPHNSIATINTFTITLSEGDA